MADRPDSAQVPLMGRMGLWSGVGLVMANMIGAGVFLSAGYMAQELRPGEILLAWVVGALIALLGVRAYSTVAKLVPRSGGEYRYLSALLHPALGYLAGWGSLLVGFSAPIAIDALAAGAFARTLFGQLDPTWFAAGVVVVMTVVHAFGLRLSVGTQNTLVLIKVVLVAGFLVLGLAAGSNQWPVWEPPNRSGGFPWQAFMTSLFFVGFAFSGWNAAIYAAEEFREPRRDVGRAMGIGCSLVAWLYMLVNWVFVANLTPDRAQVVFQYETARITLGHLVTEDLLGPVGGTLMSVLALVAFLSAVSAMAFAGPRVYSAMAKDGFLPRGLIGKPGRPPVGAVLLQGALALGLLFAYRLQQVLENAGAVLMLFSALTVLSLFVVRFGRRDLPRPSSVSLLAAALYLVAAGWMFYFKFKESPVLLQWVGAVGAVALLSWAVTYKWRRSR